MLSLVTDILLFNHPVTGNKNYTLFFFSYVLVDNAKS